MNASLRRRISAAEIKTKIVKSPQIVVRRRPFGMDAAALAAWHASEPTAAADTTVLHLSFVPWPPRSLADAHSCIRGGLVVRTSDLVRKIQCLPDYAEKAAVLAGLAS